LVGKSRIRLRAQRRDIVVVDEKLGRQWTASGCFQDFLSSIDSVVLDISSLLRSGSPRPCLNILLATDLEGGAPSPPGRAGAVLVRRAPTKHRLIRTIRPAAPIGLRRSSAGAMPKRDAAGSLPRGMTIPRPTSSTLPFLAGSMSSLRDTACRVSIAADSGVAARCSVD